MHSSVSIYITYYHLFTPQLQTVYIIQGWELGDFPLTIFMENRRKIEPHAIYSCLIPHLLVVFTRQLEILVTAL